MESQLIIYSVLINELFLNRILIILCVTENINQSLINKTMKKSVTPK